MARNAGPGNRTRTLVVALLALGTVTVPVGVADHNATHNDLTEPLADLTDTSCETRDCVWLRLDGSFLDTEAHEGAPETLYWGPFRVWNEGIDGAGSGLDADALDGLTSGQFLRSDASGTLAGDLHVDGAVSINSKSRQGLSIVTDDQGPYALAVGNRKAPSDLGMFVYDDGTADVRNRGGGPLVLNSGGGAVGIGTSTPNPAYAAEVASPGLLVDDRSGGLGLTVQRADDRFIRLTSDSTTGFIVTDAGQPLAFRQGSTEALRITANGNVHLGPAGADYDLVVASEAPRISVQNSADQSRGGYLRDTGSTFEVGTHSGVRPLAFAFDSVEKMRIDTTGMVGIGTTSPAGTLHLKSTNPILILQDSDSTGNEQLGYVRFADSAGTERGWFGFGETFNDDIVIQNNYAGGHIVLWPNGGNVGIGRTPANAKLEIVQEAAGEGLRVDGTAGGFAMVVKGGTDLSTRMRSAAIGGGVFADATPANGLLVQGNVGIGTTSPGARLDVSGGVGEPAAIIRGLETGALQIVGADSSAQIKLQRTGTSAGTAYLGTDADQALSVRDGSLVERFVVQQDGDVGIGTVSPASQLDVETMADGEIARFRRVGAANNVGLFINADEASGVTTLLAGGSTGGPLALGTNAAERVRIGATGNVGIGTTDPQHKFVVSNGGAGGFEVVASSNSPIIQAYNRVTNSYEALRVDSAHLVFSDGATERVRIDGLGGVHIGTPDPVSSAMDARLRVLGGPSMTAGWNRVASLEASYPVLSFNSTAAGKRAGIGYDSTSAMRFWVDAETSDLPVSGNEAMTILNNGDIIVGSGKVGLGISSPAEKLHVYGGSIIAQGDGTSGQGRLIMAGTGVGDHQYEWYPNNPIGTLSLYDRTAEETRLIVEGDGDVGIGTPTPRTALDVGSGTVSAAALSLDGSTLGSCVSGSRGAIQLVQGGAGQADVLYMCMKSISDSYSWKPVVTG